MKDSAHRLLPQERGFQQQAMGRCLEGVVESFARERIEAKSLHRLPSTIKVSVPLRSCACCFHPRSFGSLPVKHKPESASPKKPAE
jgi:hypothetical protein